MNKKTAIITTLILSSLIYLPSINGEFLKWDDNLYVYENPLITLNWFEFIKFVFTSTAIANFHPLTMLAHKVDYSIWGLNPWGHHLTNIILNTLNTVVVYFIVDKFIALNRSIFKKEYNSNIFIVPILSAIFFTLHPAHVENVAWISSRKDLLFFFFYGLSVLSYLIYIEKDLKKFSVLCFGFFILALISKPMAVSLPLTLIVIDIYYKGFGNLGEFLYKKVHYFIMVIALSVITVISQDSSGALIKADPVDLPAKILNIFASYYYYVKITFLPVGFVPVHIYEQGGTALIIKAIAGLIIIVVAMVFSIRKYKTNRFYLAGFLFYILSLAPIVGLIRVGAQGVAERYFYLTSVLFAILIAIGCYKVLLKSNKIVFSAVTTSIIIYFSILTISYMPTYKTTNNLWTRQINIHTVKSGFAYEYRANDYFDREDYKNAIKDYLIADSQRVFKSATIYKNLAISYVYQNEFVAAVIYMKKALALQPNSGAAHFNLGLIYKNTGEIEKAKLHLLRAYELGEKNALRELEGL